MFGTDPGFPEKGIWIIQKVFDDESLTGLNKKGNCLFI